MEHSHSAGKAPPSVALDPLRSRSGSVFHGARLSDGTVRSQVSTTSSTHQRERVGLASVRRVPYLGGVQYLSDPGHLTCTLIPRLPLGGGGRRITFRN